MNTVIFMYTIAKVNFLNKLYINQRRLTQYVVRDII